MVNLNLAYKTPVETSLREVKISEKPVKWCSVSLSEVVSRGKRLEASVFDVEAIQAYDILTHGKYPAVNLISTEGPVSRAYYGGRLKRHYIDKKEKGATGFLGSSEMLDCNPKPVKYMLNDDKATDVRVNKGDVLISRSGTIGNVTYVGDTLARFLVSEHAIRMECKEYSGYVYAFLKSQIGKQVVCSTKYGAVIQEIEPEHLATVPIPNAPEALKQRINDLIVRSYELRDESNDLIDQATALLVNELKLPDIGAFDVGFYKKTAPVDTFNVKLSEMSERLDASYHVPIADAITEHLQKYAEKVTTIADKRISKEVILPGRFKRIYVDKGYGRVFIGGKQIYELDPTNKKYLSNVHHGDRISKQLELHENMTLITCSGTIGKVALVGKHWENWTANQHIIRIVPANKDIAGYLNIFLASDYGFQLITRFTYGSVVDEIDDNHVRAVPVPILKNRSVQQEINKLALEANQKRYEAFFSCPFELKC